MSTKQDTRNFIEVSAADLPLHCPTPIWPVELTPQSIHTGRNTGYGALPLLAARYSNSRVICPGDTIKVPLSDAQIISKILVIAPSWVGDTMLMQPMLVRLKQRYPDSFIDVLAPPWTEELLRQMPEVSNTITNQFPHGAMQLAARFSPRHATAQHALRPGYCAAQLRSNPR